MGWEGMNPQEHALLNMTTPVERLIEIERFGTNPGNLRAFLHVPVNMAPGAALVVALHGCAQHLEDFAMGTGWLALADRFGFAVLFPEQQRTNNPHLCFNWFEPGDIRRDQGEAGSIRQMVDHVVTAHGFDPARIYMTGLSAGGAMANVVLALYPELFSAGAIIAGLPFGTAIGVSQAFLRMQDRHRPPVGALRRSIKRASPKARKWPRMSIWHGSHDHTVRPDNAELIIEQWLDPLGLGETPDTTQTIGGHVHRVWLDSKGQPLLEAYRVRSAGHGIPISTAGSSPVGQVGPFMLEADISSTVRIAHFFGLVGPEAIRQAEGSLPLAEEKPKSQPRKRAEQAAARSAAKPAAKPAPKPARKAARKPAAMPALKTAKAIDRRFKKMVKDAMRISRIFH